MLDGRIGLVWIPIGFQRGLLTRVLEGGDDEFEAVARLTIVVGDVLERQKVTLREYGADLHGGAATGQVGLVVAERVRPVEHEQVVIAVQGQLLEAQHEALQDRVRLEGEDAVQVRLVLRRYQCPVNLLVEWVESLSVAQFRDVVWKGRR